MTKKEFYNFIAQIEAMDYDEFYILTIIAHFDKAPFGKKINLNSYFKDGINRTRLITALKFIQASDKMIGKRIFFDETEGEFIIWIDSKFMGKVKE